MRRQLATGALRVQWSVLWVWLVAGVLGRAAPAAAESDPIEHPYQLDWALDISVAAGAGVAWALPQLFISDLVKPSCPCDAGSINGLDRGTAGHRNDAISLASDVTSAVVLVVPFGLDLLDVDASQAEFKEWVEDALVMGQALLVNGSFNTGVKLAVQRPRPLLYGVAAGDSALRKPDNYLSFYSSHTSNAFAVGFAYAGTFALRHPRSPWRFVAYGLAAAAGASLGVMRVASGRHFPSDVLVGAAVGSGVGLVEPWLHARAAPARLGLVPLERGALLALAGQLP